MNEGRERWTSRTSFIIASIGAAIGLGNVWRFPYMCYENGGGAFLIPYFVALFTAGIPLMIVEYGLGRKMQAGAPTAFAAVRKGTEWIGWLALMVVMLIFLFYPVIMAWCVDYVVYAFNLGWGSDAKVFFERDFLQLSGDPGILGGIRWPIVIGLAVVWLAIYLSLFKGLKALSKIVFYTVITPWVILVIMVIRGLTLPGAIEGLKFYLTPNFAALLNPRVWLAAYGQIFFTLSLAMGTMIVYSSYLPRKSDITNNSFMVSLANCGTSFFAGFAVFSILGYLAQAMGVSVPQVTQSGFGLAFITYPTAIRLLPFIPAFFGILFFLLLLTLGIDSAFSQIEPFVAGFTDKWHFNKKLVLPIVCVFGFLIGVIFTTRGGYYWLDIVDYFASSYGLTLVGLLECIVIGYIYKAHKMRDYVNEVSEFKIGKWWDICIKIITPIILGISLILSIVTLVRRGYGGYPTWATVVGIVITVGIIIISFVLMSIRGKVIPTEGSEG
ncbi:MAG: sodium-dependent transporter [candidate division WOR-3 bacterium]|nr:MAG: sodium-dependent transporter [candidate division WOR-3 bacterium]